MRKTNGVFIDAMHIWDGIVRSIFVVVLVVYVVGSFFFLFILRHRMCRGLDTVYTATKISNSALLLTLAHSSQKWLSGLYCILCVNVFHK